MKRLPLIVFVFLCTGQLFGQKISSSIGLGNGVVLNSVVEPFNVKQHKYDTCDMGHELKTICLIDGKIWFGSDTGLELPRNQLMKLTIKTKGKEVELDVTGMYNVSYTGTLREKQFKIKLVGEEYRLYGFFSDGAGTYTAHWTIIRGKSFRQIITRDEREFYWEFEK